MSRRRFDNLEPERRRRLVETAAEEIAAKGYGAASLNRILERAGMSKSSLYYYFDDKADFFTTLVDQAMDFLFREIGGFDVDALTAQTFWSELEAMARRAIETMNSAAWWVRLGRLFYQLRGDPRGGAATGHTFQTVRRWVSRLVDRGQALGVVRSDLPQSLLVDGVMGLGEAMDRWLVDNFEALDQPARRRLAAEQTDLFRRLLAP